MEYGVFIANIMIYLVTLFTNMWIDILNLDM